MRKCPECGATLDEYDYFWECSECGYTEAKPGYELVDDEDEDDRVPIGCAACGGDYPNCKDSCPIFDT